MLLNYCGIFCMATFLSPLRAYSWCQYTPGSGFSRILRAPYVGPRTGSGNSDLPLKKVSPYFCLSLALNAWGLGHSYDSALALPATPATELTCGVWLSLGFGSGAHSE